MEKIITVKIEKTNTGYSSYSDDMVGCIATGETLADVKVYMEKAVKSHIELSVETGDMEKLWLGMELVFKFEEV